MDGNAIVYCQGAFGTTNGKTAHGLVRRTRRYRILSVVDAQWAGRDAGEVLDGSRGGIPVLASIEEAVATASEGGHPAERLVVGLAPDGGRLPPEARRDLFRAVELGLGVDSGLHDFLTEDEEMVAAASRAGVDLRDIRRTPERSRLHSFSGKISEVECLKVAILGTDSAVGKRTTAWLLTDALEAAGHRTEMVGTGQTAWLQGARYCIILDSLINDFVAGEIEHAVWSAWTEQDPDVILVEGQGSLLNPAYPGGFEILAAARPEVVILQHAPARREYDGFPGFPLHPLDRQIDAVEMISEKSVVAIAVNHEEMTPEETAAACRRIEEETGLPACDPLREGCGKLVEAIEPWLEKTP